MRVQEKVVAEVVKEASIKMSDPRYAQTLVGSWVQQQPNTTQYMSAHARELGGAEGVVSAAFHASLMATCFNRQVGRSLRKLTFDDLDGVSNLDRDAEMKKRQPALYDYLVANVEHVEMRKMLMLIGLGMDRVA